MYKHGCLRTSPIFVLRNKRICSLARARRCLVLRALSGASLALRGCFRQKGSTTVCNLSPYREREPDIYMGSAHVLVPHWSDLPNDCVRDPSQVAQKFHSLCQVGLLLSRSTCFGLTPDVCQLPGHLQWSGSHSSCECGQLRPMGDCWFHLQLPHPEEVLWMVAQVQLYVVLPDAARAFRDADPVVFVCQTSCPLRWTLAWPFRLS